MIIKVKKV